MAANMWRPARSSCSEQLLGFTERRSLFRVSGHSLKKVARTSCRRNRWPADAALQSPAATAAPIFPTFLVPNSSRFRSITRLSAQNRARQLQLLHLFFPHFWCQNLPDLVPSQAHKTGRASSNCCAHFPQVFGAKIYLPDFVPSQAHKTGRASSNSCTHFSHGRAGAI